MVRKDKKVFVSYRRKASKELAQQVHDYLTENDFDVFLDSRDLGAGDWLENLKYEIRSRPWFILLLGGGERAEQATFVDLDKLECENAIEPITDHPEDIVRFEIEYARDQNRIIIPIWHDHFDVGSSPYLQRLANLNAIQYDKLNDPLKELRKFLEETIDARQWLSDARQLMDEDKHTEVIIKCSQALSAPDIEASTKVEILSLMSEAASALEKSDIAVDALSKAIDIKQNDAFLYFKRSIALHDLGQLSAATKDLTEVIRINEPKLIVSAFINQGEILFQMGNYEDAMQHFEAAKTRIGNNSYFLPSVSAGSALCYFVKDEVGTACKEWQKLGAEYLDIEYVRRRLGWHDVLVDTASQLLTFCE